MKLRNFTPLALLALAVFPSCGPRTDNQEFTESSIRETDVSGLSKDLSGKFKSCPLSDQTPSRLTIETVPDEPLVDPNRPIKDFSTKWVVHEFFRTPDTLFNFLRLVYTTVGDDLAKFRAKHHLDEKSIVFLFKGGNIMRMIANEVFDALPPAARTILHDAYAENFSRSDADFMVVLNPEKVDKNKYEGLMRELVESGYQSLNKIRTQILANPDKYANFLQLKSAVADKILLKYFDKLPEIEAVKDPTNEVWNKAQFAQMQLLDDKADPQGPSCKYAGQFDYVFDFNKNDKTKIVGTKLTKTASPIMNTINFTLEWPASKAKPGQVKFYLNRSKVQLEYTYLNSKGEPERKPIGGELIDISYPHRDDFRIHEFFNHVDTWVARYDMTFGDTAEKLSFLSESIPGLAADLFDVLFNVATRPWEDRKYEKRINRLFFFAITDSLTNFGLGSQNAKSYVDELRSNVIEPLETFYKIPAQDRSDLAATVACDIAEIKSKWPQMPILNEFFEKVGDVVENVLLPSPEESDPEKFAAFTALLQKNLEILEELSQLPPSSVDLSGVYHPKLKSLF